jgi:hypothetical protein
MHGKNSPVLSLRLGIGLLIFMVPVLLSAAPLVSHQWGFQIDLPEGYQYVTGDGKDRFSFRSQAGTIFDLVVYAGNSYPSVLALAEDVQRRLRNQGGLDPFEYRKKQAVLLELRFPGKEDFFEGWGLCVALEAQKDNQEKRTVLLLALAYGPVGKEELQELHLSALDSIAPTPQDRHAPGPITEYSYPRGVQKPAALAGIEADALVYEHDAEAAQSLIDREFNILSRYTTSPLWKEAWIRFYRAIFRDSFDRLAPIAFVLERYWNVPPLENRAFAEKVLGWVQGFTYERDVMGSDFINLVSVALEGRGDCDSRSLLWAIILVQANIPAAVMVSPHYSHAMGLADLPGTGAHFNLEGKPWLVAETTAAVALGLINAEMSDTRHWLGITFE